MPRCQPGTTRDIISPLLSSVRHRPTSPPTIKKTVEKEGRKEGNKKRKNHRGIILTPLDAILDEREPVGSRLLPRSSISSCSAFWLGRRPSLGSDGRGAVERKGGRDAREERGGGRVGEKGDRGGGREVGREGGAWGRAEEEEEDERGEIGTAATLSLSLPCASGRCRPVHGTERAANGAVSQFQRSRRRKTRRSQLPSLLTVPLSAASGAPAANGVCGRSAWS